MFEDIGKIIKKDGKQIFVYGNNEFSNIFVGVYVCLFCVKQRKEEEGKIIYVRGKSIRSVSNCVKKPYTINNEIKGNTRSKIVFELVKRSGLNYFLNSESNLVICNACRIQYYKKKLQIYFNMN